MEMESAAASTGFHQPHMERKMSAMTCEIFNELRLEGKLCDVVIKVNGFEFNAHKNILCSCSSYFRALFTSGWNNIEKKVYNIPGITPDMMKLIIEYAYTRTVPITPDNMENLLVAADQFNIMGIVRACCEFLESELCLDNCIGICKFTDYIYCPELRRKTYTFILHNFEEMVKVSEEFLELSVTELKDIIEKDELNVKQEDAVFEAIVKWTSYDPQNRKQHISVLLPKVRLGLMHAEYFMTNVKMNDYVKDSEECKPVIINALKAMYDLNMNGSSNSDFTNPLTRPRLPYAILFAIGGWSGGSPTNTIEAYDARADRWLNVTCEEESPRAYHGTAYLKGYVYIIGGFDSIDYFNSVKRFNPVKKTWHQVSPMHSKRCYVSVTVLGNFIYAMGGFDGYVRLNTAERYEPETNQWTLIAPMHEQRSDASATTLHGKVYICGGFNGNECLSTAEVYSAESNQWTVIAPMRSRRSGIGVIAYGEHVYAVGGFDGANRLRSAEVYSPAANIWRTIPTMFTPRSNFGIGVVDDLLFVVGGFNGFTTTFNVECYDEKSEEWYDAHDMSIYRSALSCCVVPGLANVEEYAARRGNFTGLALRDEVRHSASTSTLPV
ncbi:kelch-like protein 10 [Neophocaena asiaeorientalis asiaeorientalis]|uniref:Kelch-like protein 10 n=1 Tax=Neophocaena asiaeorientalis asiaeorientalis TaxID=1706337 RepID=A0A341BI60_NEOAA|nr:kelch-like protein 10 [Neophocaena asiaeorientalis asiaeorientalis]